MYGESKVEKQRSTLSGYRCTLSLFYGNTEHKYLIMIQCSVILHLSETALIWLTGLEGRRKQDKVIGR